MPSLSVNHNYHQQNVSFKGSMKRTENGSPYYHSNSGTKLGTGIAFIMGGSALAIKPVNDAWEKAIDKNTVMSIEEKTKILEKIKNNRLLENKFTLPVIASLMGIYIACGAIVDMIRNNKAKKSADLVKKMGIKRAMIEDENIEISQNNRPYHNSSSGAKYGALIGAVAMPLTGLICDTVPQLSKGLKICSHAVSGAICGAILGAITDHFANKKADKLS